MENEPMIASWLEDKSDNDIDNDKQFTFRHVCPYNIKRYTLCTMLKTVMVHQEKTIQIIPEKTFSDVV